MNKKKNPQQQPNRSKRKKPSENPNHEKEPLPMKLRALPQSFWQQPNTPNASPGDMYQTKEENLETSHEISIAHKEIVSEANTDLLFSLFRSVEGGRKLKGCRRGRQKRILKKIIKDDDPYLTNNAIETLLKFSGGRKILTVLSIDDHQTALPNSDNYSQILSQLVVQL